MDSGPYGEGDPIVSVYNENNSDYRIDISMSSSQNSINRNMEEGNNSIKSLNLNNTETKEFRFF